MYSPGKSQFNDYQYQEGESDEKETYLALRSALV
jgi:hypothetical protein